MGNLVTGLILILCLIHGLLALGGLVSYEDSLPGDVYLFIQSATAFAICAFFLLRRLFKLNQAVKVQLSFQFIIAAMIFIIEFFSLFGAAGLSVYAEESGLGNLIGGIVCILLAGGFCVVLWLVCKKLSLVQVESQTA